MEWKLYLGPNFVNLSRRIPGGYPGGGYPFLLRWITPMPSAFFGWSEWLILTYQKIVDFFRYFMKYKSSQSLVIFFLGILTTILSDIFVKCPKRQQHYFDIHHSNLPKLSLCIPKKSDETVISTEGFKNSAPGSIYRRHRGGSMKYIFSMFYIF